MRPKIKKMTFDKLADNFEVVSVQEQALYIGGARIYLNADGSSPTFVSDGSQTGTETLILNGNEIELPLGTWNRQGNSGTSATNTAAAKKMFAFLGQYSTAEWMMAIRECGTVGIFTCHNPNHVGMRWDGGDTIKWVHSHPLSRCSELSGPDFDMADAHRHKYHALFYNGQFRSFDSAGFYGDWRDTVW